MKLRGWRDSHFIWSIQDGVMKKVHNTDSHGRTNLKFKKLEDIYQHANAEYTQLAFAERNTTGNGYAVEEDEAEVDNLTLSQLKKTCKKKKRKSSESVLLTPKAEDDDSDLSEPLFKFRVKVLKSSKFNKKPANGCFPISELRKDFATVSVKVEAPEMDYLDCREMTQMADGPFVCDGSVRFIVSETGFVLINPVPERSEVSLDSLENMEVDNEENMANGLLPLSASELENEENTVNGLLPLSVSEVENEEYDNQSPSFLSSMKDDSSLEDNKKPANECFPISKLRKDLATVSVKVEAPEMDYLDCRETTQMADGPFVCDGSVRFIVSETGFVLINPVPERSEVSPDSLENMEVDNEENMANGLLPLSASELENEENTVNGLLPLSVSEVENEEYDNQSPSFLSSMKDDSSLEDNKKPANECFPISKLRKDLATVSVKVEAPEMDYLDCRETTQMADGPFVCDGSVRFIVSETGFVLINPVPERSEVSLDSLENMEVDNEENMANGLLPLSASELENEENTVNGLLPLSVSEVENEEYDNQSPSFLSSMKDDSSLEDWTASTSDCSQSQQTPEEVNYISSGQDSDSTVDEALLRNQELSSLSLVPDSLSLPWSHSWLNPDDHAYDVVPTEAKLPESEEKQHLTLENTVADSNSMNSEHIVFVPANTDSEVKLNHNYQTDIKSETTEIKNSCCIETRQPERLPLTRKAISPNSQKKLCQAMESEALLDDMDNYKCKEKLYFEEQTLNKFSSTKSDVEDTDTNVHPQHGPQFNQNKVSIGSKHVLRRSKNYKKGSPPKKGCLDGPRLCRSLPCLSTGCTSIQGCSESAIAFSQRQMHDIETLASKLMSELDSMKALVEEKMLYEAYRSLSLKNEAVEVKSAIKSATKTEAAAKKWLSMMTRDCNRFCKIMKLNEDDDISASTDPALGNTIHEKPRQRERKKICFADEAGGMLCDIKVFQIDRDSLEQ